MANITSHSFITMTPELAAEQMQNNSREIIKGLTAEANAGKLTLKEAFKIITILNSVDCTKAKKINQEYDSAVKELLQVFDKKVKNFHYTFTAMPMTSIDRTTHKPTQRFWNRQLYEAADLMTEAIKRGHLEIIESAFSNYAEIDQLRNSQGETLLEVAIAHDCSTVVKKFLSQRLSDISLTSGTRSILTPAGKRVEVGINPPPLHVTNDEKNLLHLLVETKSPQCLAELQHAVTNDRYLYLVGSFGRALYQPDNRGLSPLDILLQNPSEENKKIARVFLEIAWDVGDRHATHQLIKAFGESLLIDLLATPNDSSSSKTRLSTVLAWGNKAGLEYIISLLSPDGLLQLFENKEHIAALKKALTQENSYSRDDIEQARDWLNAADQSVEILQVLQAALGVERFARFMQFEAYPGSNAFLSLLIECNKKIIGQLKDFLGPELCKALIYGQQKERPFKSLAALLNIALEPYDHKLLFEKMAWVLGSEHAAFLADICRPEAHILPLLALSNRFSLLLAIRENVPDFENIFNSLDQNGNHQLHYAAMHSQFSVYQLLQFLSIGLADVATARTLLHLKKNQFPPQPAFPIEQLAALLSAKNNNKESPLNIAMKAGNVQLLHGLMYFAEIYKYEQMPAIINQSANMQDPHFLDTFILLHDPNIENKYAKGVELLRDFFIRSHPQLPFASAIHAGSCKFLWDIPSDTYFQQFLAPYPQLFEIAKGKSYAQAVEELKQTLNQQPRETLLEVGLLLGNQELLFEAAKLLTPAEYKEQLASLKSRFPGLGEKITDKLDNVHLAIDESHMQAEKLAKIEINRALLAPFNYQDIYTGFKQVNFSDKTKLGYRDPAALKNDVGDHYVSVTVPELDAALNLLFNTRIPNKQGVEGTPPSGTPEIKQYYANLKEQYQEVLYHMDQLKRLKETNPDATEADLRDAADAISRGFIAIAVSALHCGSRWQEEVEDTIRDLKGAPASLEEILHFLMGTLRSSIAETIALTHSTDSHTRGTVFSQLAQRMAIPGASRIIEHLRDRKVKEEKTVEAFYNLYTPAVMYRHLLQKMEEKPKIKAAILDWFKDNPGTWHKEEYADKLAAIKEDPAWQVLLDEIHNENKLSINNPLSQAFLNINIPEDLPKILADINYEISQKPEDYSKLIEMLFRKTHSQLDPELLRMCCSLLSTSPSLQTAFHEIFSQFPDYKSNEIQTSTKFLVELDKIEKSSKIMAFLNEKHVSVDKQMAEKMATQPNYNEILTDMLERQRGEEFAKGVYFSPGSEFIDKFVELATEDYELLDTLRAANTLEKFASFITDQWKDMFEGKHPQALETLLQRIEHDKDFAAICKTCLLNPDSKNQKHLKELLLELPNMNYQFQRKEIMRLLEVQGFIRKLA